MNYWWVNQNQTYKSEVGGGFLWSPKARADRARNQFHENMQKVAQGAVVFSFCDTQIKAIGVATARAVSAVKPDFWTAVGASSNEGWLVQDEFTEIAKPTSAFCDSAFADEAAKTNLAAILEQHGIQNVRSL